MFEKLLILKNDLIILSIYKIKKGYFYGIVGYLVVIMNKDRRENVGKYKKV